jgi:osmotically-inducible protein OsmY
VNRSDEDIKRDIVAELFWDSRIDASNIRVEVVEGLVTLSGEVPTFASRSAAEFDVWQVVGVQSVDLRLTVHAAAALIGYDDLTAHLRNVLEWNSGLDASGIEITAEGGVATLSGSVQALWQKQLAEDLVSAVAGVTEVVNRLTVVPTLRVADDAVARDLSAALARNARIDDRKIDVTVRNGSVTLSGVVGDRGALEAALDAARLTPGVTEVVEALTLAE